MSRTGLADFIISEGAARACSAACSIKQIKSGIAGQAVCRAVTGRAVR